MLAASVQPRRAALITALRCISRSIGADAEEVWATQVKLLSKEKALEVEFSSGERFRYPAELLRVESPAAAPLAGREGRPRLVSGRRHVGIIAVEPVGLYAVRLQFDDMHGHGLYTWSHLHELGQHKVQHIKSYLRKLRELGLSRDPPGRSNSKTPVALDKNR